MTLEESILEAIRALPPERQREILEYAEKLQQSSMAPARRWNGKGLWSDLKITLSAEEVEENQREMWSGFAQDDL